jgi:hypothetical protein
MFAEFISGKVLTAKQTEILSGVKQPTMSWGRAAASGSPPTGQVAKQAGMSCARAELLNQEEIERGGHDGDQ